MHVQYQQGPRERTDRHQVRQPQTEISTNGHKGVAWKADESAGQVQKRLALILVLPCQANVAGTGRQTGRQIQRSPYGQKWYNVQYSIRLAKPYMVIIF